ncbi:TatD family hydrolase [Aliidiomarina celeris]|uniref:TatD family hydrolase n=1 Tax=Aliidiomarina celeris TaxID=2249428 RepID=UPI000DEA256B|nr:YchF/TatD family DNA exonuclease [Aliidiomarina celeris]
MQFVDSHCHLDKIKATQNEGIEPVLARATAAGVEHILCIGVTLEDYPQMRKIVGDRENVSFSCGVHPLYMKEQTYNAEQLRTLVADKSVVAVGETGLDYYYDKEQHKAQQESFASHIEIACEVNKPLIIHTRDAHQDTIGMLKEGGVERCGGVLHCFTESLQMAREAIELGFYISISGIATFRNAEELRQVVRQLPIERILIETDAPWLAPVPHRGKENEPAYVVEVARCVAALQGVSVERVAEQTRDNFYTLFSGARKT